MAFTVGSVFSGIGGTDIGFERAGADVLWFCEVDAACRKVLQRHWPGIPRFKDVKTVTGSGLGAAGLRPDCLVGGFPCQDLSVAGARAGLNGERSALFFEFARLLEETQPQWFLIENVPGMLSAGCKPPCPGGCVRTHGGAMGAIVGTLVDLGYGVAWRVLDAQYFGVAQRRRRVFIVGCAGDRARAEQVLLVGEGGGGDPPARREKGTEVAGTLGGGSGSRGWCDDLDRATFIPAVSHSLCAPSTGGSHNDHNGETLLPVPVGYRKATTSHGPDNEWERWEEAEHTNTLDAGSNVTRNAPAVVQPAYGLKEANRQANGWGIDEERAYTLDGQGRGSVAYPVAQRGRDGESTMELGEPDLHNALRAGDGGSSRHQQILTPELAVRRLTPLECLRLQGFPDDWLDGLGLADSVKYRMAGNAVAVPVVSWIASRMVAAT